MLSVGSSERCTEPFDDGLPTAVCVNPSDRADYADTRVALCNSGLVKHSMHSCVCHPPRLEVDGWEPCEPGSVAHVAQTAVFQHKLRTAGLI